MMWKAVCSESRPRTYWPGALASLAFWASMSPQKVVGRAVAQAPGGFDRQDALKQEGLWVPLPPSMAQAPP